MSLAPAPNDVPELRAIPDCPGYLASADGRIFSTRGRDGVPRELAQFDRGHPRGGPSPYLSVSIQANASRGGKRCNRFVHELVLLAWVGPRPGSADVWEACHGPGGSKDNSLSNLRWATTGENAADRSIHAALRKVQEDHEARGAFDDLLVSDG